jgi:UDP-glucuronate 4-epimerase
MSKVLVTGSAGFIGHHTALKLNEMGFEVVGFDSINDYYTPQLKLDRLKEQGVTNISETDVVKGNKGISFIKANLENKELVNRIFAEQKFDYVIHLAAQAGVRYSIEKPQAYIDSNIIGTFNILEACRNYPVKHLVMASSSSVYGLNKNIPFSESDMTDEPISLYAASKKSNELMAHTYAHLFKIPTTALRFFTVYGPWGRPDMAIYLFTDAILNDRPIKIFNNGNLMRDFTYIDDIVNGITKSMNTIPNKNVPFEIYNIGNSSPVKLLDFIEAIEKACGKIAIRELHPMQPGDVEITYANTEKLSKIISYKPNTPIEKGISEFVGWFRTYYNK